MIDREQINAAAERFEQRKKRRERNERLIKEGRFLEVDDPERVETFVERERASGRSPSEEFFTDRIAGPVRKTKLPPSARFERMIGTNDLLGVAFLDQGLKVASSVGRIWVSVVSGQPQAFGTGFLVTPSLLLTNHHVLEDTNAARNSVVEFDYQLGYDGLPCPTSTFELEPDRFFVTSEELDFTMVAVAPRGRPDRPLTDYTWNPLIEAQGKIIAAQWMNIIQHPNGEPKQLSFRENQLVDVLDNYLHYKTDTAPGSSGAPVYNDRWEVVGLHHSGVWDTDKSGNILAIDGSIWHENMGENQIKWIANEGVRISRVIGHVHSQALTHEQRALFEATTQERPPMPPVISTPRNPITEVATSQTSGDGSVTLTVPLTITLRFGAGGPTVSGQTQIDGMGGPVSRPDTSKTTGSTTDKVVLTEKDVLEAAKRELSDRADIIDIRIGYLFKNGWITNERAVVVTVRDKKPPTALRESGIQPLPDSFLGFPVEVTSPSIEDLIRLTKGSAIATEAFQPPAAKRNEITYVPPTGATLKKVAETMRVRAHVSPDAGWQELNAFLKSVKKTLTVAMYDFGAPHIVTAVANLGKKAGFKHATLVMQRGESVGEGTKADDLTDQETVDKIEKALKAKFDNAWVKIGKVNGWVSSSYHIKVAVRDSSAFWLSSGNWQSSNQPNATPYKEKPQVRRWLNEYNRDWHAIIDHPAIAKTYETFIKHDFDNNQVSPDEAMDLPDILVPAGFLMPLEAAKKFEYFAPFDESRKFTVTPLLTPDNYHEKILNLIEGAQTELLIQNQTFKAPGDTHVKLKALVDAVMDRIDAGVDVRVIFRVLMPKDARDNLTALKDYGFPTSRIKIQQRCHTKGIIVDRKRIVLGSQNWSNDGVSVNRDASLLFEDAPLSEYFRAIFEHDWAYQ
ncbi:MAG: phospholipase D-like domain-containing protein, partial [Gemmatimonadales bacterium]